MLGTLYNTHHSCSFGERSNMTKSRTIRWVLLVSAVAIAGYFGWQRYNGFEAATKAENAQKLPKPRRRPVSARNVAP